MDKLVTLALVVQAATEAIARLYPRYTVYVAAVVGLAVSFLTQTGLLGTLGIPVSWAWADWLLSGLVLAGGAGVVHSVRQWLASSRK